MPAAGNCTSKGAAEGTWRPCHHPLFYTRSCTPSGAGKPCLNLAQSPTRRDGGQPQLAVHAGEAAQVIFPQAKGEAPAALPKLTPAAAWVLASPGGLWGDWDRQQLR